MDLDKLSEQDSKPNTRTTCVPGARQESRFDLGNGVHPMFPHNPDAHLGATESDDYWDYMGNCYGH